MYSTFSQRMVRRHLRSWEQHTLSLCRVQHQVGVLGPVCDRFFLVVLGHTDEQYNNLLNTRELMIVINIRLSNRYFTQFIWQRLPIHFEVNWVICSLYVKLQSILTRFITDLDDVISLLSSVMLRSSGIFIGNCGVPRTRSFVFSGLMSRFMVYFKFLTW